MLPADSESVQRKFSYIFNSCGITPTNVKDKYRTFTPPKRLTTKPKPINFDEIECIESPCKTIDEFELFGS